MVRWLREVDAQRLGKMVAAVNHALGQSLKKSMPGMGFDKGGVLSSEAQKVMMHCRLLELLFRTNQMKERIPNDLFKNKVVIQSTDPATQFKRHFKG
jgi:hypothetical protein